MIKPKGDEKMKDKVREKSIESRIESLKKVDDDDRHPAWTLEERETYAHLDSRLGFMGNKPNE